MYSNDSEELHRVHNQVIATINLFQMRQEKRQSLQNFRDQFTAMRQVYDQLGLSISQTEKGAKAIMKQEGVINPSGEQLSVSKKKAAEEYFAIIFLYMAK